MVNLRSVSKAFAGKTTQKATQKGNAGYDNARENIDPHIKTKVISTKELTLSDGSATGYVQNGADGKLTGGHSVSAGLWEVDGTETQLITADEIDMQTKKIINVVDPTANQEAATKKYVDDQNLWVVGGQTQLKTPYPIDMQTQKIIRVVDPTLAQDAATKNYVDNNVGGMDWTVSQAPTVIHTDNYTDTTYSSGDFDHNSLLNYVANEHIDWTGATDDFLTTGDVSCKDVIVSGTVDGVDVAGMSGFVILNTNHRSGNGSDHTDVATNTAKFTNVDTDLSVTKNATTMTVVSSDGDNAVLVEADTTNAGILGSDKWDEIVANTNAKHAESHNIASHSDTTATGTELNTLTDNSVANTLHRHSELSASDGTPDRVIGIDSSGTVALNTDLVAQGGSTNSYPASIMSTYSNTGWHGAFIINRRYRGSSASPTTAVDGDYVFYFDNWGYDGTDLVRGSQLTSWIDGTVSTGVIPMGWKFNTMNDAGNFSTRLIIKSSGNVGIGTTSPTSKLQVGTGTVLQQWTGTTPYVYIQGGDNEAETVHFQIDDENLNTLFTLKSTGSGSDSELLIDGDVGIGDTTPSQKLDVAGTVRADDFVEFSQPIPTEKAMPVIMRMKNKKDGTLDHKTFPKYTKKEIFVKEVKDDDGKVIEEAKTITKESVSLSAQV